MSMHVTKVIFIDSILLFSKMSENDEKKHPIDTQIFDMISVYSWSFSFVSFVYGVV